MRAADQCHWCIGSWHTKNWEVVGVFQTVFGEINLATLSLRLLSKSSVDVYCEKQFLQEFSLCFVVVFE